MTDGCCGMTMHATDRVLQMRPCGFDPAGSGQILVVLSADSQSHSSCWWAVWGCKISSVDGSLVCWMEQLIAQLVSAVGQLHPPLLNQVADHSAHEIDNFAPEIYLL